MKNKKLEIAYKEINKLYKEMKKLYPKESNNNFVSTIADELNDAPELYKFSSNDFLFWIENNFKIVKK